MFSDIDNHLKNVGQLMFSCHRNSWSIVILAILSQLAFILPSFAGYYGDGYNYQPLITILNSIEFNKSSIAIIMAASVYTIDTFVGLLSPIPYPHSKSDQIMKSFTCFALVSVGSLISSDTKSNQILRYLNAICILKITLISICLYSIKLCCSSTSSYAPPSEIVCPTQVFILFLLNCISINLTFYSTLQDMTSLVLACQIFSIITFFMTIICMSRWVYNNLKAPSKKYKPNEYLFLFHMILLFMIIISSMVLYGVNNNTHFTWELSHASSGYIITLNYIYAAIIILLSIIPIHISRLQIAADKDAKIETKAAYVRYVSHELRTPLNTVSMGLKVSLDQFPEMMTSSHHSPLHIHVPLLSPTLGSGSNGLHVSGAYTTNEEETEFKQTLIDTSTACDVALDVLNELLLYDKIESGNVTINKQHVKIIEFVRSTMKMFAVQTKEKNINLLLIKPISSASSSGVHGQGNTAQSKLLRICSNGSNNAENYTYGNNDMCVDINGINTHTNNAFDNDNCEHASSAESVSPVKVTYHTTDAISKYIDTVIFPTDSIYMDKSKIGQVLRNLLSNSIKFTPKGGEIKVLLQFQPDYEQTYNNPLSNRNESTKRARSKSITELVTNFRGISINAHGSSRTVVTNSNQGGYIVPPLPSLKECVTTSNGVIYPNGITDDLEMNNSNIGRTSSFDNSIQSNTSSSRNNITTTNNTANTTLTNNNLNLTTTTTTTTAMSRNKLLPTTNTNNSHIGKIPSFDNSIQSNISNMTGSYNISRNKVLQQPSSSSSNMEIIYGKLIIEVTDNGCGISETDQKKLFKEIVQFKPEILQNGGGSGLGMWISKNIVNLHDGHISVYSPGEGHGTTFRVELPMTRTIIPQIINPITTTTNFATSLSSTGRDSHMTSVSNNVTTFSTTGVLHSDKSSKRIPLHIDHLSVNAHELGHIGDVHLPTTSMSTKSMYKSSDVSKITSFSHNQNQGNTQQYENEFDEDDEENEPAAGEINEEDRGMYRLSMNRHHPILLHTCTSSSSPPPSPSQYATTTITAMNTTTNSMILPPIHTIIDDDTSSSHTSPKSRSNLFIQSPSAISNINTISNPNSTSNSRTGSPNRRYSRASNLSHDSLPALDWTHMISSSSIQTISPLSNPSQKTLPPSQNQIHNNIHIHHHHHAKILIVDDSKLNRKMLKKLLLQGGYICDEAEDGLEGLNKVRCLYDQIEQEKKVTFPTFNGNGALKNGYHHPNDHKNEMHLRKSHEYIDDIQLDSNITTAEIQLGAVEEILNNNTDESIEELREKLSRQSTRTQMTHTLLYDAILMDFMMPNMDGRKATAEIRKLGYQGLIVGISGTTAPDEIDLFMAAGASQVFTKPLDTKKLQSVLASK